MYIPPKTRTTSRIDVGVRSRPQLPGFGPRHEPGMPSESNGHLPSAPINSRLWEMVHQVPA